MFPAVAFVADRLAALNPRDDVDIVILSDSKEDLEKADAFGVPARLIYGELPVKLDGQPNERITVATFFRLFVPDYLSQTVERIVHLDADTYPENDKLFQLFDLDMKDFAVAAVQDIRLMYLGTAKYLAGDLAKAQVTASNYLNSGLLLIDRKKFVKQKIGHRAFEIVVNEHLRNDLVFNRVLAGQWLRLSPSMNAPLEFHSVLVANGYRPVLTHFIGEIKPWHGPRFVNNHPARKEMEAYILKSPWRDFLAKHYGFQAAWDALQRKRGGATFSASQSASTFRTPRHARVDDLVNYLQATEFADVRQGITETSGTQS